MDDVYENMEEYDPNKYRKIYIMLFHEISINIDNMNSIIIIRKLVHPSC